MRLTNNQIAPDFMWRDIAGQPINLQQYRNHCLLLSFYRYASCPLCNLRVHELLKHYPLWQAKGLVILGVFESPVEHIHRYLDKHAAPFPILPDPERTLYQLYRVTPSWLGFIKAWTQQLPMVFDAVVRKKFFPGHMDGDWAMVPADFLITPQGVIAEAFYGTHIGDHIPIERIETFLHSHVTTSSNIMNYSDTA